MNIFCRYLSKLGDPLSLLLLLSNVIAVTVVLTVTTVNIQVRHNSCTQHETNRLYEYQNLL